MDKARPSRQPFTLVEQTNRIMGTDVSVHVAAPPSQEADARAAVEAAMAWLREVDQRLTRFNPESELCQLNDASGEWHTVSELVFTAVQEALNAAEMSAGLFDPTMLPQLEALGYDRDFAEIAREDNHTPESPPSSAASSGSWRAIQMDPSQRQGQAQ